MKLPIALRKLSRKIDAHTSIITDELLAFGQSINANINDRHKETVRILAELSTALGTESAQNPAMRGGFAEALRASAKAQPATVIQIGNNVSLLKAQLTQLVDRMSELRQEMHGKTDYLQELGHSHQAKLSQLLELATVKGLTHTADGTPLLTLLEEVHQFTQLANSRSYHTHQSLSKQMAALADRMASLDARATEGAGTIRDTLGSILASQIGQSDALAELKQTLGAVQAETSARLDAFTRALDTQALSQRQRHEAVMAQLNATRADTNAIKAQLNALGSAISELRAEPMAEGLQETTPEAEVPNRDRWQQSF